ncbi:glycosyltransferase [Desulfomonile tiedjei]|uniref:Glycosyltransferase n=1 Tax=Desulfomonile tiedjei (strain ATCC 49306 / DSM 6799 / DCB-1) TaxID=706587 RepID=I4C7F0_DESTA|nr:glycosyltransferase [Desulfomonile tiedjei]AFM25491.1 glycosyltransferase [Desulfomonile tiedjei DSM 6799]
MRVLHLIYSFYRGGLESWLISMLGEVSPESCRMDVCCMGPDTGPWAEQAEGLGACVFHIPLRPDHLGFYTGLRRVLKQENYDLIHNHLGVYSGFPVWIARNEGVPVITTFHNTDFTQASMWWLRLPILSQLRNLYARLSIRYALEHTDILSGVSQGVLNAMISGRTDLSRKSRVLYLGVRVPPVSCEAGKRSFRESLGFGPHSKLILHVGRFIEQKNHRGLLEVFRRLVNNFPDARLILIGEGPLKTVIREMVESAGLDEFVRFLGLRDDVLDLMTKSDMFLLPSLHEGLPVVALEAQAAGLPVVGSRIPGLSEAVEEGTTALLHDVHDTDGMADSVLKLLRNPGSAEELARAGRERIQQQFSLHAAAGRLLALYAELLAFQTASAEERANRFVSE